VFERRGPRPSSMRQHAVCPWHTCCRMDAEANALAQGQPRRSGRGGGGATDAAAEPEARAQLAAPNPRSRSAPELATEKPRRRSSRYQATQQLTMEGTSLAEAKKASISRLRQLFSACMGRAGTLEKRAADLNDSTVRRSQAAKKGHEKQGVASKSAMRGVCHHIGTGRWDGQVRCTRILAGGMHKWKGEGCLCTGWASSSAVSATSGKHRCTSPHHALLLLAAARRFGTRAANPHLAAI
jgi:hypothetical protein